MNKPGSISMAGKMFVLLLILFYIHPCSSYAQELLPLRPPIRNYPPKEYGAHNQVWCVAQDNRGVLYFGAGTNILEYDGVSWRKIHVKAGATVTSMAYDHRNDRLYVGTHGDFGYLDVNVKCKMINVEFKSNDSLPEGTLYYQSLLGLVPKKPVVTAHGDTVDENRDFQTVWRTHVLPSEKGSISVFFNAYTHLYHYDGKRIEALNPEAFSDTTPTGGQNKGSRFFLSSLVNGSYYIEHRAKGILQYHPAGSTARAAIDGKSPTPEAPRLLATHFEALPGTEEFVKKIKGVYSMLPLSPETDELLLVTRFDGLFLYRRQAEQKIVPFQPAGAAGSEAPRSRASLMAAGSALLCNSPWVEYSRDCQPYYAIQLPACEPVAATLYDGLIAFLPINAAKDVHNASTLYLQAKINRESGLLGNRVYYIYSEENQAEAGRRDQHLWIGLNNGISRINYPTALSYYDHTAGIEGGIESILQYKGRLWLAAGSGIYYSRRAAGHAEKGLFTRVEGIDWQCFDMERLPTGKEAEEGTLLLAAGHRGLCEVSEGEGGAVRWKQLGKRNAYCISRTGVLLTGAETVFYYGGTDGLHRLEKQEGKWQERELISSAAIKNILTITQTGERELWLGTRYEGLYRVLLDEQGEVLHKESFGRSAGLPEGQIQTFPVTPTPGKAGVVVATDKGLFEIQVTESADEQQANGGRQKSEAREPAPIRIVPCTRYGGLFAGDSLKGHQVFRFTEDENKNVWMIIAGVGGDIAYCSKAGSGYKTDTVPFFNIMDKTGDVYAICPAQDGITWFGGKEGLARYDANVRKNYSPLYYALVRKVVVREDSVIFNGYSEGAKEKMSNRTNEQLNNRTIEHLNNRTIEHLNNRTNEKTDDEGAVALPYELNNIRFEYAAPFFEDEEKTVYSYRLEGFNEKWSEWSTDWKTSYTNLPEREYVFKVKAKNIYAHESEEGEYRFEILPPFHRTWAFYGLQVGFIVLLFAAAVVFSRRGSTRALRIATMLVTLVMFIIFEYVQNYAELSMEGIFGGITVLKVLLNVILAFTLFPIEGIVRNVFAAKQKFIHRKEKKEQFIKRVSGSIERLASKSDKLQKELQLKREYERGKGEGKQEGKKEGLQEGEKKGKEERDRLKGENEELRRRLG